MPDKSSSRENDHPRVLMYSQRNIFRNAVYRCPLYEFEDTICKVDSVDVLAPSPGKWFKLAYRLANRVAGSSKIALNPGIPKLDVGKRYDMFFAICAFPKDLLNIVNFQHFKKSCGMSVCLIDEMWVKQLYRQQCFLKILSGFDHVFLYYSGSVDAVSKLSGTKCHFLPPGVDAVLFCPYPDPPRRVIDVYTYGRMSGITHRSLLEMAGGNRIFYLYDTRVGSEANNLKEHRLLLANAAKRSRYFIVNPGLIDRPDVRGDQIEVPNRFFEGAAAGAILVGETPYNGEFEKLFDWPDAVHQLPYDSENISSIIRALDADEGRQERIRISNVTQSLGRHDWLYRWKMILDVCGLDPMPGFHDRKKALEDLSKLAESQLTKTPAGNRGGVTRG